MSEETLMKPAWLLAFLPAVCFFLLSCPICGQENSNESLAASSFPDSGGNPIVAPRISGTVKDPAGAVVPGARVEITNRDSGFTVTATTDHLGRFTFETLAPGRYELRTIASGFDPETVPILVVGTARDL